MQRAVGKQGADFTTGGRNVCGEDRRVAFRHEDDRPHRIAKQVFMRRGRFDGRPQQREIEGNITASGFVGRRLRLRKARTAAAFVASHIRW